MINAQARPVYGPSKRLDWALILLTALLCFAGLMSLFSLDKDSHAWKYFPKQAVFAVIGVGIMAFFTFIQADVWKKRWIYLYGINIFLLVLILVIGKEQYGAQRWIDLGVIDLQPSELSKIFMSICLAAFFADHEEEVNRLSLFAKSFLLILPVLVLLMMQPHLGATMGIIVIWMAIGLAAGVPWKFPLITTAAVLLALVGAFFSPKLPTQFEYMRERIIAKLQPDPQGNDYQVKQAEIAIGSGQIMGAGIARGEQKHGGFIPLQQNDFIFTVIGEEGGFVGSVLLLGVFASFLLRGWWTGIKAQSLFGRLIVTGLVTVLGFHFIVNMGMNLGITPVVGLWLPFISYGGTALWMCMASVGLILSVHRFDTE
jgi:rod shape determining protein RodA